MAATTTTVLISSSCGGNYCSPYPYLRHSSRTTPKPNLPPVLSSPLCCTCTCPPLLAPLPRRRRNYCSIFLSEHGVSVQQMYVTPPDTDIYSIPRVLALMPQKGPIETSIIQNRRADDPDFFLDFEEIYVIDSKTRSITRAKVVVSVPEGKTRDRWNDLLLIRDGGESFRITDKTKRDDATTVIQREEWAKSRQDVEKHFRKLRDFDYSNWF
ncbi:hypothetical protein PR202_gb00739 [Eleusine coracana subsp. coracana]|uniref:Uncharacterized protein n=1 Tax=Eleusine coracana subsp. coracana TaxID=191504 RepID=A0AAV5DTB9_ELECO|nr:hypothetical protein PR202_gb00739 [Eleusine coracana subsp. coracana]